MTRSSRSSLVVTIATLIVVGSALGATAGFSAPAPQGILGAPSTHGWSFALSPFNAPLIASLSISPGQVQKGQSISLTTTASGGTPPLSYNYYGLPPGCTSSNTATFGCSPSSTGTFPIQVSVTDSKSNNTLSNTVSVTVTSSGSGNGGGSGNNSSNPFSSLLSGLGGFLQLLIIFGLIGFATWILLIVGVWIIAIVLLRRLPKRGATMPATPTVKCAACSAAIPGGSKFCPECGTSTAPKTPPKIS